MLVVMVRIPVGSPEEAARIESRFTNRAGSVENQPGFLGFELLKGEGEYVSVSRWESREAIEAYTRSRAHASAHAQPDEGTKASAHPQPRAHERHAEQTDGGEQGAPRASSTLVYEVIIPQQDR